MRVLILFLLVSTLSFAQLGNPIIFEPLSGGIYARSIQQLDSINVRWKLISSDKSNHFLFQSDDSSSLSTLLIKAILDGEDVFYFEENEVELKTKMYPKVYQGNRLKFEFNDDDDWATTRDYLQICLDDDYPLKAEDGDPIILTDGGNLCYIYPASDQLTVAPHFDRLTIKIREEYTFNPITNKIEWTPVGISLASKDFEVDGRSLWIDLRRLLNHNPNRAHRAFEYLFTKSYTGFQYMQFFLQFL